MAESPSITSLTERRFRIDGLPVDGILKHPRPIYVHLPEGYEASDERYPVIYNFDGEAVLTRVNNETRNGMDMDAQLDDLVRKGAANPAILVAIPNSKPGNRGNELIPREIDDNREGGTEAMHRFITERLKPFIDSKFRTRPEAASTGISGFSLGGLACTWLGYRHPETYGMVGALSPSIQYGNGYLPRMANEEEGEFSGTRFWFGNGGHEFFERNLHIRTMIEGLVARGWEPEQDVQFALQFGGGHSERACRERMPNMLGFLLEKEPQQPLGSVVVAWENPDAEALEVSEEGEGARGLLQLDYPNGRFSHLIAADWKTANPTLFRFHEENPGLPIPIASEGATEVGAIYLGWQAAIPAVWREANLAEPHMVKAAPAENIEAWQPGEAIPGHDTPIYLAAALGDDALWLKIAVPAETEQVKVAIDCGNIHELPLRRYLSQRKGLPDDLLQAVAPDQASEKRKRRGPIPGELTVLEGGKLATFRIPNEALDSRSGSSWSVLRINAYAEQAKEGSEIWWQPPWQSADNIVGSGLMIRT